MNGMTAVRLIQFSSQLEIRLTSVGCCQAVCPLFQLAAQSSGVNRLCLGFVVQSRHMEL